LFYFCGWGGLLKRDTDPAANTAEKCIQINSAPTEVQRGAKYQQLDICLEQIFWIIFFFNFLFVFENARAVELISFILNYILSLSFAVCVCVLLAAAGYTIIKEWSH
jgi:hypothetical protein